MTLEEELCEQFGIKPKDLQAWLTKLEKEKQDAIMERGIIDSKEFKLYITINSKAT